MPFIDSSSFRNAEILRMAVLPHASVLAKDFSPLLPKPKKLVLANKHKITRRGKLRTRVCPPMGLKPPLEDPRVINPTTSRAPNNSPYLLKGLDSCYVGEENHNCEFGKLYERETGYTWHVKYLNKQEKEKYRITVDGHGLFVNATGKPLFTTCGANFGGAAMFIMDAQGQFLVSTHEEDGAFQHSSLAGGGSVAMAGEIRVDRGRVNYISNSSGHYKPGRKHMNQCLERMRKLGVNLRGVEVDLYGQPKVVLRR